MLYDINNSSNASLCVQTLTGSRLSLASGNTWDIEELNDYFNYPDIARPVRKSIILDEDFGHYGFHDGKMTFTLLSSQYSYYLNNLVLKESDLCLINKSDHTLSNVIINDCLRVSTFINTFVVIYLFINFFLLFIVFLEITLQLYLCTL